MQLQDLREKYNLKGSFVGDICESYCCLWCSLVRAEKESKDREVKLVKSSVVDQQYVGEVMTMEQPVQQVSEIRV
jgi:hypothetical protein